MTSGKVSICWENFHKNMCTGMSSLLKNEDLVDVTIAVEGKYFKAHKMVLSLCSPYFRELFKVNPCKHPIFFMKDVSYSVMSDLLHFMYYGEVQVNQENVSAFRKTAEALQITGLTADRNTVQRTVNEKKNAPSPEIDHRNVGAQEPLIIVKMEPNDDPPATSTLVDDEFYEDPLYDEKVDDITVDYPMIEEEESKPGTSSDISISSTRVGGLVLGEDQEMDDLGKNPDQEDVLSERSKKIYMKVYSDFKDWYKTKGESEVTENVILVYLQEKAINRKASSLWSTFSMLKQTLKLNDNVDITKYYKVLAFLKRQNDSYKPKKAAVFEEKHIRKFIAEAPDDSFFSTKVILIMGIAGACKTEELCNIKLTNLDVREDLIIVNIPKSKNKTSRKFVIAESSWIDVVKRYVGIRPSPDMEKLFIGFRSGKPVRQNIGHNTISSVPNKVAKYLKLPNADDYTGHSLRRTSAKILANNGGEIITLKRLGNDSLPR